MTKRTIFVIDSLYLQPVRGSHIKRTPEFATLHHRLFNILLFALSTTDVSNVVRYICVVISE